GRSIKAPTNQNIVDKTRFDPTLAPTQRLGWGGDGSPGSGTLREFAIGAITQHFPKTLNRKSGVDFRLPTDEELDALEAFQLSLGRSEEPDITKMVIKNALASKGRDLYVKADPDSGETKKCQECHFNGGANTGFDFAVLTDPSFCLACIDTGLNATFDIGI